MAAVRRSQRLSEAPVVGEAIAATKDPPANNSITMQTAAPPTLQSQGKRQREEGVVTDDHPVKKTFVKHETHWDVDGNLLLQIGNTRFKVHRRRLMNESPWFNSLIERRAGRLEDGFEDQAEIDEVVESVEEVDGLDLYYLDLLAKEQFGALLTAMEAGIDYVYQTPNFATIELLFAAAVFFRMQRYEDFAMQFLRKLFPDSPHEVVAGSSPHAVRGVSIGRSYGSLSDILRRAFYDLARSQPEYTPKGLSFQNYRCLIKVQKHLSLAWDRIAGLVEVRCVAAKTGDCNKIHRLQMKTFLTVKNQYPFDPILGVQELLKVSWSANGYCDIASKGLRATLQKESKSIWADMTAWITIPQDSDASGKADGEES